LNPECDFLVPKFVFKFNVLHRYVTALELTDAAAALRQLTPVSFSYLAAPGHATLGFIAEDVPPAVAQEGRAGLSALPVAAVLARVAQGQEARIARLEAALERMERRCAGTGGGGKGGVAAR
jgi:hypothetical protein